MKAIAYYRSRPGEPDASNLALERQRAAVQRAVQDYGLAVVGEFVEREGEAGSEGHPSFIDAVEAEVGERHGESLADGALRWYRRAHRSPFSAAS